MSCKKCGAKPEHNGRELVEVHHLGCPNGRKSGQVTSTAGQDPDEQGYAEARVPCAREGCAEPRAVSKGPRPAKFCDEHKTKRSSK
jgi:hypothetical protein